MLWLLSQINGLPEQKYKPEQITTIIIRWEEDNIEDIHDGWFKRIEEEQDK